MAEKMYLTAYTYGPLPRPEYSRDGLQMNCNESCLFLGNRLLPKDTVTLIELTVNSYTPLPNIRHLPLYVGVHEEPSLGILNASCCFGSLFYEEGKDYDCFEHVNGGTSLTRFVPSKIYSRIPAATEVIGIKYDPLANEISIYRDGNLFYKFSPQYNNLATGDFYPAVFVMNNCNLDARINFGKKGLQFPQTGAMSLFGFYFKKKPLTPEIVFDLIAEPDPTRFMVDDDILVDLDVDSDILPGSMVPLYMESPQATFTDPSQLKFDINKPSATNFDYFGTTLTSNRGVPFEEKVYVEFQVKNGVLLDGTVGIPISVGLSNTKGHIMNKSIRLNMFHLKQQTYMYKEVKSYTSTVLYTTSGIMTTVSPNQSMWVGVAFDLKNREYTVSINSIPFYTVKVPSLAFTPGSGEFYYFMLHQEGIEKNDDPMDGNGGLPLKGEVNFGQTTLHTVLPSGYMTLWDYYNNYYHIPILPYREISFDFMAYPYKMKLEAEILWHFRAIGQELFPQEASGNPGINQFKGTMNRVMDDEPHFIPDQGIQLLDLLMRFDNFNYTTEKLFEKEDFFRGQDIYIGNWENRVLRYIDFEYYGENKRKIPDKEIEFIVYNQNKIPDVDIDFNIESVVHIETFVGFEIYMIGIESLNIFVFDIISNYNASTDTTQITFKHGLEKDKYENDPFNYYLENGTPIFIPFTNPIDTVTINGKSTTVISKSMSLSISGIFTEDAYSEMLPDINGILGPNADSKAEQINNDYSEVTAKARLFERISFNTIDTYNISGNIDVTISGGGVSITTAVNITIPNITHFPIRYTNYNYTEKRITFNDVDGTDIVWNATSKQLTINKVYNSNVLNDWLPFSGITGYSNSVNNIVHTTNIAYSGDMHADFVIDSKSLTFTNLVSSRTVAGDVKYFVQIEITIGDTKWEVIKHYISTGALNNISITYNTISSDIGTFVINIPKASINTANSKFVYSVAVDSIKPLLLRNTEYEALTDYNYFNACTPIIYLS